MLDCDRRWLPGKVMADRSQDISEPDQVKRHGSIAVGKQITQVLQRLGKLPDRQAARLVG
ncbi:hypothetical protein GCM10010361_14510 [Streptomyces olivaceiscleroticus]|uniref:Uncharacterized protein n=1 Tax=Streptomyces olivaceiscleroticus TaxID=68245 RepID=A0ABN0ZL23_9ACTN